MQRISAPRNSLMGGVGLIYTSKSCILKQWSELETSRLPDQIGTLQLDSMLQNYEWLRVLPVPRT